MYAFYEFRDLTSRLTKCGNAIDANNRIVRYLCALVAELAYCHVPAFELPEDDDKRAKYVPCGAYNTIVAAHTPNDVEVLLGQMEFPRFVRYTDNIVAVGILHQDILFIGFRGTRFFFDFVGIDFRTRLVDADEAGKRFGTSGPVHRGFASGSQTHSQPD